MRSPPNGRGRFSLICDLPDPGTRLNSILVRCPICEGLHEWKVADESLATLLAADHHANGARFINPHSALQDFYGPRAEITELREQLLDEFNHRLKNNLQMLYGLLEIARQKRKMWKLATCYPVRAVASGRWGPRNWSFTPSATQPMSVGKDYWKLYVRMPKPSLVRKYRSIARQLLDICQKKPRYRSR